MIYYDLHKALENPEVVLHLSLAQANLKVFPIEIQQFRNLKVLDLRKNQIPIIPDWIGKLNKLEALSLQQNEISALPETLEGFEYLQKIDLSFNHLKKVDTTALPIQVKELYLANNKIRSFSTQNTFPQLKRLDLTSNQLSRWPKLQHFPSLTFLKMGHNKLKNWFQDEGMILQLEHLDLHRNKLENLPPLTNLKALQFLNLSDNRLHNLPKDWIGTPYLQSLLIAKNKIQSPPYGFGQLQWLKNLDLSHNDIEKLPKHLFDLPRLHHLNLSHNQIKGTLRYSKESTAKKIDLGHNQLTKVKSLSNKVSHLIVRYNPIIRLEIPPTTQEVIFLDATKTLLKKWPESIFNLTKLKTLKGVETSANNQTIVRLIQRLNTPEWTSSQKQTLFYVIKEEHSESLHSWSNHELLTALQIYSTRLRHLLIEALLKRKPVSFEKGKTVAIFGKLQTTNPQLNKLLEQNELSIKEQSELVILGKPPYPKTIESYKGKAFYSEAELLNFLNQAPGMPDTPLTATQENRLIQLLFHPGKEQVKMGLMLLPQQISSPKLKAALLIAWKMQPDPALKKSLRQLIGIHGSPDQALLRRPLSIQRGLPLNKQEQVIEHWLKGAKNVDPKIYQDLLSFLK